MRSVSQLILESELLTVKVRMLFEKNMLRSEGVCIILPKTKYGEETHTEPSNLRAMTVQPRWQYVLTGDGASAAQIWYTPDFL